MKEVVDIQKLFKRQKSYQKGILVMIGKLFDIQNQINDFILKEAKKGKEITKDSMDLLSAKDVCSMLEISSSTLYRMRTYDGFPCIKGQGRKSVMFRKKDIDEYLDNIKKRNND